MTLIRRNTNTRIEDPSTNLETVINAIRILKRDTRAATRPAMVRKKDLDHSAKIQVQDSPAPNRYSDCSFLYMIARVTLGLELVPLAASKNCKGGP
jgi:hypothetical protein